MEKSSDCKFNTSTFLSLDNLLESRKNSVNSTPRISPEMSPPKEDEDHEEEIKIECFEIEQGGLNTHSSRLLTKENLISKYQKFQKWAWGEEKD